MITLSNHTRLVNLLLALSRHTPDLDHPLDNIGYSLEHVGLRIVLPVGNPLVPDLSFRSANPNELLLIEAKSGGVNNEQARKYASLDPVEISKRGLTSLEAMGLSVQVCYAVTAMNRDKVLENEKRYRLGFPIITFQNNLVAREPKSSPFKNPKLEKFFSDGVKFRRNPSTEVFPFSADDSRGWIAFSVASKLIELNAVGISRFTELDLTRRCHPLMGYFSRENEAEIRSVVHKTLTSLRDIGSTRLVIRSLSNQEWEISTFRRVKSVRKMLMDLAEKLDSEPGDLRKFLTEAAKDEAKEPQETLG